MGCLQLVKCSLMLGVYWIDPWSSDVLGSHLQTCFHCLSSPGLIPPPDLPQNAPDSSVCDVEPQKEHRHAHTQERCRHHGDENGQRHGDQLVLENALVTWWRTAYKRDAHVTVIRSNDVMRDKGGRQGVATGHRCVRFILSLRVLQKLLQQLGISFLVHQSTWGLR